MGHTRLGGSLPRSRQWNEVVGLIESGAGAAQIAVAVILAAERGLNFAADDKALIEAVWLLTQLPLAAKNNQNYIDFVSELRSTGLQVSDNPGVMEIVGAFSDAIDARLINNIGRTDLGEMAQMAASETLTKVLDAETKSLFGAQPKDVQKALATLATNTQFSRLARQFFARIFNRCLNYYVSRVLSLQIGEGRRFSTLAQQSEFTKALALHCHEASKIVETFSGEWFSKTLFENGSISREKARGFTHIAIHKLVSELKAGARENVK